MFWYKKATIWQPDFLSIDDMFSETKEQIEHRKNRKKISEEKITEPYIMPLYRGINLSGSIPETLRLDPAKSEQGLLWFTHSFIRGYNSITYAENHGLLNMMMGLKKKK